MPANIIRLTPEGPHLITARKIGTLERRLIRILKTSWLDITHSKYLKVGNEYSYHPDFHDLTLEIRDNQPVQITVKILVRFRKEYAKDGLVPDGKITITIESDHARFNDKPLVVKEPQNGHALTTIATTIVELAKRGHERHTKWEAAYKQVREAVERGKGG